MGFSSCEELDKTLMLIVNPVAGRKMAQRKLSGLVKIYMENGYRVTTFITRKHGDAESFAANFGREYDLIVCVGGDGTLSETVSGVITGNVGAPIGYIPAGSSNDFAACHGIDTDVYTAAAKTVEGDPMAVDVGLFDDRTFTYIAAFGAFSWLSYTTPQNLKNTLGHSAYIIDGIRELPRIKPVHMRVESGGKVYEGDYIFGAVSNVTGISGVLKLPERDVVTDDGKFEVTLVREPETLEELGKVISSILSGDMKSKLIDYFHAGELSIETQERLDWSLDGEHAESGTKLRITALNKAVKIVMDK